ncbi:alpha/beta hydrolase [Corynebacterium sp. CCUG 70398]|uniref:alpha/beta hydrolase n=1 Tax=Corynebacterium sp. CCUG 70398 TaxID=2823891 RepID=UPI0021088E18|nr:alpha/beta hydrolase [Corynebacterium sp. CCUG 70398]MCQ4622849.1 alpha/beta hydrolase [Corynebacterium sp. CCUG 70398]
MDSMDFDATDLNSLNWIDDELDGFLRATLPLGRDPDGEGEVAAVLVQSQPDEPTGKPALLWVHGMSDYFFQEHVAKHYKELGYPFYAIDLRKCGRAHKEGQRWHYTTDLRYYYDELTAATKLLAAKHGAVIPLAHSTGGLIVPLWIDHVRRHDWRTHQQIAGQVLNSPWLDMQFPGWAVKALKPVVNVFGARFPNLRLPSVGEGTYGESIYKGRHGHWDFDTEKKAIGGHDKYLGWLRAVMVGQDRIHEGSVDAGVPTLTLCSADSYLGKPYSAAADSADTVLDVEQIKHWAPFVSDKHNETKPIDGALHDVFLSLPHARQKAFDTLDEWLENL